MSRTCPQCHSQYDDEVLRCPEDGADLSGLEPDDALLGRNVGSYRVVKLLGKGGMGAVYMAEHPVIGSRVAIKFLHPQYATDQKIVDRFFNEARAVNVIGHDNILKILDLNVTEDDRHYFIMEFLHGKALQDLVKPDEPMPFEVAGPILLQICEALQAAHDHQIVHRDLKPDNVYLIVHKGKKNFVKVVDFGIAKLTDDSGLSTGKTQTGMVMGTPAYMSPEQAGGVTDRIDGRSDIYSLGCMMYQMATGKLPFPGTGFAEVLIGHLQLTPPSPRELCPTIPAAYESVILRCLEKQQEKRYQTMLELHDDLWRVMQELGLSRELPKADEKDLAAAQPPKTRSTPGTLPRSTPRPGQRKSSPGPTRATQPATQMQPPLAPQKSNAGLLIGVAAAVLVIACGGVGFVVYQQVQAREEAHQERVRAQQEARKREEALRLQAAEEQNARVQLSVVTEPLGALAEATWKDGARAGVTPMELEVPKNAKVHFNFSKKDFVPFQMDLTADAAQVVKATLAAEPPVVAAQAVPEPRKRSRPPKPAPAVKPPPAGPDDGTIPVEF